MKTTVKAVAPLSTYEKDWSVFSIGKKIIVYYDDNGLVRTTKTICEKRNKRSELQ